MCLNERSSVWAAAGIVMSSLVLSTPPAAAAPKISYMQLAPGPSQRQTPVIHVDTHGVPSPRIRDVSIEFRVRVGFTIRRGLMTNSVVTIPDPGTWPVGGGHHVRDGFWTRKLKPRDISIRVRARTLVMTHFNPVRMCQNAGLPSQGRDIPARVLIGYYVTARRNRASGPVRTSVKRRAFDVIVRCVGEPAQQQRKPDGATRKQRFVVTGARLKITRSGGRCRLTYLVSVLVFANKEGLTRYTLRSAKGRVWRGTIRVGTKRSRYRWVGRFDHRFKMKRNRRERLWVEVKGRRIGGIYRLRSRCKPRTGPAPVE